MMDEKISVKEVVLKLVRDIQTISSEIGTIENTINDVIDDIEGIRQVQEEIRKNGMAFIENQTEIITKQIKEFLTEYFK